MYNLCVVVQNQNATPIGAANAYIQFYVDVNPPAVPTDITVTPGDGRLIVKWTFVKGISKYIVTATGPDGVAHTATTTVGQSTATVQGLTNGVTYTVTVQAVDYASVASDFSAALTGTPEDQCDFWECYQGKEKGGFCFVSTAAYGSYDASTTQVFATSATACSSSSAPARGSCSSITRTVRSRPCGWRNTHGRGERWRWSCGRSRSPRASSCARVQAPSG